MSWIKAPALEVRVGALETMNGADGITAAGLYARYLEAVFRYVLRRIPSVEEAEDITAEVFADAFVGLPRFRGDCAPQLWLLGIARRKVGLAWRRRAARRELLASELAEGPAADPLWETLVETEGPEAALMRVEARGVLRGLVAQLHPEQREALLLRYLEQLSVAEVAVVMGRSEASVKGLLRRARATLRQQGRGYFLEDEDDERA
jgi:RNA polymerase sigma-70 factor, ECF subfamily